MAYNNYKLFPMPGESADLNRWTTGSSAAGLSSSVEIDGLSQPCSSYFIGRRFFKNNNNNNNKEMTGLGLDLAHHHFRFALSTQVSRIAKPRANGGKRDNSPCVGGTSKSHSKRHAEREG